MPSPSPSTLTMLVFLPLLAWRVYARVRRMVGRQRLTKYRPWVILVIFPALLVLFALAAHSHWEQLWWLEASLVSGALLGAFGLTNNLKR